MNRSAQNAGFVLGIVVSCIVVLILITPGQEKLHAFGPMNTGHEQLECVDCHLPIPGSPRQQLQVQVRRWLGIRADQMPLGHFAVENIQCLTCHERPNDRHPVHRFLEPRFAEARLAIQPQTCTSCHLEHQGKRVTIADTGFCVNCHQELVLKDDPLDIPHERLIAEKQWSTCLGCHDFHGNHQRITPDKLANVIQPHAIWKYFEGGASPYSSNLLYPAKKK